MTGLVVDGLRRIPLFERLGEHTLLAVARRAALRGVPSGTVLFKAGEGSRGIYVLLEGGVGLYHSSSEQGDILLRIERPGHLFGQMTLFDGAPYLATARTLEESVVLFIADDDLRWLCRHDAEFAEAAIGELDRRLRTLVRLVERLALKDVFARVASALQDHARAVGMDHIGGEFRIPMTQEEMAAELGTTRESVARALGRLRRTGAIEQRGSRVRVVSPELLSAAAAGPITSLKASLVGA